MLPFLAALDLPFVLGWILSGVVVVLALRTPRPAMPPPGGRRILEPLAAFLLVLGTRLWMSSPIGGAWFHDDENLAACIAPSQLLLGEPIWGGWTHYLGWLMYLIGYRALGFAPSAARLMNIVAVGLAIALLHATARRVLGGFASWIASAWLIAGAPFIIHSIYATEIGFALLPVATVAWLLSARSVRPVAALMAGPLLVAGLYIHEGTIFAGVSLLGAHLLILWRRWSAPSRLAAAVGLGLAPLLVMAVSHAIDRHIELGLWRGTFAAADPVQGLRVLVADTLWQTTTFNSLNLSFPYLDPALAGFVIVGLLAGARARDEGCRWAWVGALAFLGNLLGASLTPIPGVRRVFPALPLLALPLARGVLETARRTPRALGLLPAAALALVLWHDVRLLRAWPRFPEPDFIHGARTLLAADDMTGRDVVVIGEADDVYRGEEWRCALALDERLAPRLGQLRTVARRDLPARHGLAQRPTVVLVSSALPDDVLRAAFGGVPTRVVVRDPNGPPRVDRLGVAYVFDDRSAAPLLLTP